MSLKSSARLKVVASPATTHCENWIQEGKRRIPSLSGYLGIPSLVIEVFSSWLSKNSPLDIEEYPALKIKPKGLYRSTVSAGGWKI